MECEICGADTVLISLPIRRQDGCLDTYGCIDCARTKRVWCDRHDRPHTDLGDGHGCLRCIEQETKSTKGNYLGRLKIGLPPGEYEEMMERVHLSGAVSEDDPGTCVRRFIITRAHSLGLTSEEVLRRIEREQSADFLFQNPFLQR